MAGDRGRSPPTSTRYPTSVSPQPYTISKNSKGRNCLKGLRVPGLPDPPKIESSVLPLLTAEQSSKWWARVLGRFLQKGSAEGRTQSGQEGEIWEGTAEWDRRLCGAGVEGGVACTVL